MNNWFCFDGSDFIPCKTLEEAKQHAKHAMDEWRDAAADNGWDEASTQVCYGQIIGAVRVEDVPVTDDNRHLVPSGCECMENHHLETLG